MDVGESAIRKVRGGNTDKLTHEEWDWWRLCGKGSNSCQRYVATVIHDGRTSEVEIYHNEIDAAAGTAEALFLIGLPSIPASSIQGIRISNEGSDENRYLSKNGAMVSESVLRG